MLAELMKQDLFREEYERHQRARVENQPLLQDRLDDLRQGKALDVLEPFAKAYLGMFYDVDSNIAPAARIYLLVNEALVEPILQGLVMALQQQDYATPAEIAAALGRDEHLTAGYIGLAGCDLYVQQGGQLQQLPDNIIRAIICFHYANSTYHHDDWLIGLLKTRPALAAEAFVDFWQGLRTQGYTYLPGLQAILNNNQLIEVRNRLIVPALGLLRNTRPRELARMLLAALSAGVNQQLYAMACEVLQDTDAVAIRQQVYWQATAFILEPASRGNLLSAFVGQEKIKILPLLDFVNWVLRDNPEQLSGEAIAELIRIIAPKFTPQTDNYGHLSDISQKVAWLFYLLAIKTPLPEMQLTRKLKKVRVLKLYKEVLDEVEALQQQLATEAISAAPEANSFIQHLHETGKLKSKKKWYDSNH